MTNPNNAAQSADWDVAHEIWAAAQTPPGDSIESAVERIVALLSKLRAPVASAEVIDALNWVDDFIARCNRDDRGSCESVNLLRRALASAPVADNWRQYALPGETTAEQVCERMNAEVTRRTVAAMRASTPVAGEAQKPVAWLREVTPGKGIWRRSVSLDEPVTGPAAVDRKTPLYAAPQASEAVRKPIMTVAEFCAEADRIGLTVETLAAQLAQRPEFADCLPPADKDGGQQRAGDGFDVEAAAKTMAECMDYPWAHMPEKGREQMRLHAQSVIRAAQGEQGERDE